MKKLLVIPLLGLLLSCNSAHDDSPLEGSWIWVASDNNELIHVYTYDDFVGIGIEMGKNRKKKMFGELEYTSDSTAVINFTDGLKADLQFKIVDDVESEAYYVKLVDTEGFWDRIKEPKDYKDDEKEKAFRSAMYVMISTKKEQIH
jgi:hypothetical protein